MGNACSEAQSHDKSPCNKYYMKRRYILEFLKNTNWLCVCIPEWGNFLKWISNLETKSISKLSQDTILSNNTNFVYHYYLDLINISLNSTSVHSDQIQSGQVSQDIQMRVSAICNTRIPDGLHYWRIIQHRNSFLHKGNSILNKWTFILFCQHF